MTVVFTRYGYAPVTRTSGRTTAKRRNRRTPEEREGVLAFWCDVPSTRNPYSRDDNRKLWNRGWHRARMAKQRGEPWGRS